MTPPQIALVTTLGLALLVLVVELVRRQLMREKYTLVWVFTALALLSVPPLYGVYGALGRAVGIIDPNSMFFFAAIMGLLLFCLQFTLAVSTAWYQRKALVQRVALLELRLRELEER